MGWMHGWMHVSVSFRGRLSETYYIHVLVTSTSTEWSRRMGNYMCINQVEDTEGDRWYGMVKLPN